MKSVVLLYLRNARAELDAAIKFGERDDLDSDVVCAERIVSASKEIGYAIDAAKTQRP